MSQRSEFRERQEMYMYLAALKHPRPYHKSNHLDFSKKVNRAGFWGTPAGFFIACLLGMVHQKGGRALFGHGAPMDFQMAAWIIVVVTVVALPVAFAQIPLVSNLLYTVNGLR